MFVTYQIKENVSPKRRIAGFTLLEVVIGIALVAVVLLGLAQLFTYSVMNNLRADRISNATFLAQQEIDSLRNLTGTELSALAGNPVDERIDVNTDGVNDFRRITQIQRSGYYWDIKVLVFAPPQIDLDVNELIKNPGKNRVMAQTSTIISR